MFHVTFLFFFRFSFMQKFLLWLYFPTSPISFTIRLVFTLCCIVFFAGFCFDLSLCESLNESRENSDIQKTIMIGNRIFSASLPNNHSKRLEFVEVSWQQAFSSENSTTVDRRLAFVSTINRRWVPLDYRSNTFRHLTLRTGSSIRTWQIKYHRFTTHHQRVDAIIFVDDQQKSFSHFFFSRHMLIDQKDRITILSSIGSIDS